MLCWANGQCWSSNAFYQGWHRFHILLVTTEMFVLYSETNMTVSLRWEFRDFMDIICEITFRITVRRKQQYCILEVGQLNFLCMGCGLVED